jgi:hypothetical protein
VVTEAVVVDLLRSRFGLELRDLGGSILAGEIPLRADVVNRLIARQFAQSQGPVASVLVEPRDGQRVNAMVSLKTPKFLPPLKLELHIDQQPAFPTAPVLGVRWSMPAMGPLAAMAAPVIANFKALPPGVRLDGERISVDLGEILRDRGLGDLLGYIASVRVTTRDGSFLIEFALRIPS